MTKNELIEKFKREMPKFEGTEEEKEIKTALYIYVELAKMKNFDSRYYFGNGKLAKKAYEESLYDKENLDNVARKRRITCVSLSYLYKGILDGFEISSNVIKENPEARHMFNIIKLKNGKELIADIEEDLCNIHTKSKLKNFRYREGKELTEENLTNLLIDVGYISKEADYRNKKMEILQQKIKVLDVIQSVENILKDEDIYGDTDTMGIAEAYKYYKAVLKKTMPELLNTKVFQFSCHKKKEDKNEPEYSICIYAEEKEEIKTYLFSKKEHKFLECDLLKLKELEEQGLVLGRTGKEPGIKKLEKIMKKEQEKSMLDKEQEI